MGMGKPQPDKRTRVIETAMKLAYRNGFRETSLADIAEAARVLVGYVYYYEEEDARELSAHLLVSLVWQ
jgi:AcrR family transcriptional regulator